MTELLRMLLAWLIMVTVASVGHLANVTLALPSVLAIMLVHAAATQRLVSGLVLCAVVGFLQDLTNGGVPGLSMWVGLVVFLAMRALIRRMVAPRLPAYMVLVAVATFGVELLVFVIAGLLPDVSLAALNAAYIGYVVACALSSALLTPAVLWTLARVETAMFRRFRWDPNHRALVIPRNM